MSSADPTSRTSGLHDDQHITGEISGHDASSGLMKAAKARTREADSREQAEDTCCQNRDGDREEQRGEIQACGGESGNGRPAKAARYRVGCRADEERNASPRDERTDRASRSREKQRLSHL
jgi:hypothetical protein